MKIFIDYNVIAQGLNQHVVTGTQIEDFKNYIGKMFHQHFPDLPIEFTVEPSTRWVDDDQYIHWFLNFYNLWKDTQK